MREKEQWEKGRIGQEKLSIQAFHEDQTSADPRGVPESKRPTRVVLPEESSGSCVISQLWVAPGSEGSGRNLSGISGQVASGWCRPFSAKGGRCESLAASSATAGEGHTHPGKRGTKGSATWILLLFSHSVSSDSATPWTAAHLSPLSFTISQSLL